MRPKTIVLFVVAVGCGLVASIGVSQYMQQASQGGAAAVETASIFVAVTEVNIGEKLDAQNVRLEEWPRDRIPEGAISELSELEDRFPKARLYVGEPILTNKLMDANDPGSKAITIPKGYRVVSVNVQAESSSVSGMVRPGDRVDLLVFLQKSGEIPETGTRTILRDVNVFSVDGETERRVDDEGQSFKVRTVSLLVKPEQAELVKLAAELGRMSLSMRRPDDTTDEFSEGVTVQMLIGNDTQDPDDRQRDPAENPDSEGFIDWLSTQASETPEATQQASLPAADIVVEEEPAWTMRILTPTGFREFRWRDANELPEEVILDNAANAAATAPQLDTTPLNGDPNPPPQLDGINGGGADGNMVGGGQEPDLEDAF